MFNNLLYTWRSIVSMPRQSILKTVSLAFGIGISILLLAKFAYLKSYDTSYKDHQNLYQVWITWHMKDRDIPPTTIIPGKIPSSIAEELSEIFSSGTATSRNGITTYVETSDTKIGDDVTNILGDTLFFETLGIELLSGNPQDLANTSSIFISDRLAKKLFGNEKDVAGNAVYLNKNYDESLSIAGVFKALPENSTVSTDMVTSIAPYAEYFRWIGGDSWWGFLRKRPDCNLSLDEINARIAKIVEKNAPARDDLSIEINIKPVSESLSSDSSIKSMMYILVSLAVTILVITIFNYVLIAIASLSRRAKAVGVHKCCGAGTGSILSMFVLETSFILLAALALATLFIFTFRGFIESTLQVSVYELFNPSRLWVTGSVIVIAIIIGGFIPGIMLSRIEVSTIFRSFTENRRNWKRVLLFAQITGATIILTMSSVVLSQLNFALNLDPGYRMKGLVIVHYDYNAKDAIVSDVSSLPYVTDYGFSGSNPIWGYSGEIIPDDNGTSLFSTNIDYATSDYVNFMGFKLLSGRLHRDVGEAIINRSYCTESGWTPENAIGRVIGHPGRKMTIIGVIEDFSIRTLTYDKNPFILIKPQNDDEMSTLQVHVAEPYVENTRKLAEHIAENYPQINRVPTLVTEELREMYSDVTRFRNLTFIAAISIFFITMMGLVGYLADEIQRRRREIAIRKANGAGIYDIVTMLARDIVIYALPGVIVGGIIANRLAEIWLEQFTRTSTLLPVIYILIPTAVFIVTVISITAISWSTASSDPANALKSE